MQTANDEIFKRFEKRVSRHRLQRYRRATATKEEAVALYLWNMQLCESLYPLFQTFEVSLRNATHDALSEVRGTATTHNPRWFMDFSLLNRQHQQNQVWQAIKNLRDKNKGAFVGEETNLRFPLEPQRVVAELSLGFWVSLYSDPFTHSIVKPIAAAVFPNGPKQVVREKRQDVIYPRLQKGLDLRNRVFHHEPIYHWTLPSEKQSLMERVQQWRAVIDWMDGCQPRFLDQISRFNQVHDNGWRALLYETECNFLMQEEGDDG